MSWLSSAWDHNRNFLGNAVKNVSPLLAFTPLGPLGAGAAGALGRGMQKGATFGDILKSGLSNAAIGTAAHGLYGAAQGALGGAGGAGSGAGGASAAAPNPSLISDGNGGWLSSGGQAGGSSGSAAAGFANGATAAAPAPPSSFSSSLMNHLSSAGKFAKENATVLGGIGSGILNAREQGQTNDLKQQQFDFEKRQYEDQMAQRQRIAALLSPLYSQVYGRQTAMAPNPYGSSSPQTPPLPMGS